MKRKGSLAASTLFHSDNETLWKQSLDLYQEAVKLKADMHPSTTTKDLVSIDQWFHIKLPKVSSCGSKTLNIYHVLTEGYYRIVLVDRGTRSSNNRSTLWYYGLEAEKRTVSTSHEISS